MRDSSRPSEISGSENTNKKKEKLECVQLWQINAAAKRPAASELIEVAGGEGGRRRATQKINWKKINNKIVNSQTGSGTWVLIWLNTHTYIRPHQHVDGSKSPGFCVYGNIVLLKGKLKLNCYHTRDGPGKDAVPPPGLV